MLVINFVFRTGLVEEIPWRRMLSPTPQAGCPENGFGVSGVSCYSSSLGLVCRPFSMSGLVSVTLRVPVWYTIPNVRNFQGFIHSPFVRFLAFLNYHRAFIKCKIGHVFDSVECMPCSACALTLSTCLFMKFCVFFFLFHSRFDMALSRTFRHLWRIFVPVASSPNLFYFSFVVGHETFHFPLVSGHASACQRKERPSY
jgi:hypothetical protein